MWWYSLRLERLQKLGGRKIKICIASDCSGAGAPERAWQSVARVLENKHIARLEINETFGSEHPRAYHCHKYLRDNFTFGAIYIDVVKRAIDMLRALAGKEEWRRVR